MEGDGQTCLAAEAEQIHSVGIVVEHSEFNLAAHLYVIKVHCRAQRINGIGTVRIGGISEDESIGCAALIFQTEEEGDRYRFFALEDGS